VKKSKCQKHPECQRYAVNLRKRMVASKGQYLFVSTGEVLDALGWHSPGGGRGEVLDYELRKEDLRMYPPLLLGVRRHRHRVYRTDDDETECRR